MSSGLVGLHMEDARKGTHYNQGELASPGRCSLPTISKASDVKYQNKKVCLIHLALTFLSLWEVYGARCLTSGVS